MTQGRRGRGLTKKEEEEEKEKGRKEEEDDVEMLCIYTCTSSVF